MPGRRRDAEYFCRCVVMETNICLRTLHSNNDVTWSGARRYDRLPVILAVLYYHTQTIQKAIIKWGRPYQIKYNFNGRLGKTKKGFVLTVVHKNSQQCPIFCSGSKHFLRNTGALPFLFIFFVFCLFTQLPSKLCGIGSSATWSEPGHILTYPSCALEFVRRILRTLFHARESQAAAFLFSNALVLNGSIGIQISCWPERLPPV